MEIIFHVLYDLPINEPGKEFYSRSVIDSGNKNVHASIQANRHALEEIEKNVYQTTIWF